MYRHAERGRGANEVQAHYLQELSEMARPIGQAVVALAHYTVEFQDRHLNQPALSKQHTGRNQKESFQSNLLSM